MKTIHVPEDLHQRLKIQAAKDSVSVQTLVEMALALELSRREKPQKAKR